jgi:hypothetical protein
MTIMCGDPSSETVDRGSQRAEMQAQWLVAEWQHEHPERERA